MTDTEILESLFSENPQKRIRAITTIKQFGIEKAVSLLLLALDNENIIYRRIIIATLLSLGKPTIPILLQNVRNSNPVTLEGIVQILSEICGTSNSLAILNLLNDKNPLVRASALTILGSIKDIWSLSHIREFTKDAEPVVRAKAAQALGNMNDKLSVDLLLQLLTDDCTEVKIAAIEALAKLNDVRSCDNLWQLSINDKDSQVRKAAWQALKTIGDVTVNPYISTFLSADVNARTEMVIKLSQLGRCVILSLIEYTKHYDASAREIAAMILGNIGDNAATTRLIELTKDVEQKVRIAAVIALGKIHSETALRFLISCLRDPDPVLIENATDALAQRGEEIIKHLPDILSEQDMTSQITLTRLIARIQDPNLVHMLAMHLSDQRIWIRQAVCFALGEIKNPIAANILTEKCLFDPAALVRSAAAQALGKLKMPFILATLISALDDAEEIVKIAAIKAIGEMQDKEAGQHILRFLSDPSIMLRITAIQILAKLHYLGAIPILKKMARGWLFAKEPEEVRVEAKRAIQVLKQESKYARP